MRKLKQAVEVDLSKTGGLPDDSADRCSGRASITCAKVSPAASWSGSVASTSVAPESHQDLPRDPRHAAVNNPFSHLYDELRRLASSLLRHERPDHTLQTTELVHEAYLRLADWPPLATASRNVVFGIASKVIRDVLVDHARRDGTAKRGGDWRRISLAAADEGAREAGIAHSCDLLDLDVALNELATTRPRQAQVVEMRYFGGMSGVEIADALGVTQRTITDDWSSAKEWLRRRLTGGDNER